MIATVLPRTRRPLQGLIWALSLCLIAKSSVAQTVSDDRANLQPLMRFENQRPAWQKASCPQTDIKRAVDPLKIIASPISLGPEDRVSAALPKGLHFAGAWHLTATDKRFGGLSGLARLDTGDLLAVSDAGYFITIGLSKGTPDGRGSLSVMRDARGLPLSGKRDKDAEGLTLRDGIALVSFERHNRILAYDLKTCGALARGVLVTDLPEAFSGQELQPNRGPEALELTPEGFIETGYETVFGFQSWIFTVLEGGGVTQTPRRISTPIGFNLVGLSAHFLLFRAYDPVQGNRTLLQAREGSGLDKAMRLKIIAPLAVDNFEAVTDFVQKDGTRVIYILSDDNFSNRQRTLLLRFEIHP